MLHWRLMSTLARVLLLAGGVGLLINIAFLLGGARISFFTGVVVALVVCALIVRRRDLDSAIAVQLQRDADEEQDGRDAVD